MSEPTDHEGTIDGEISENDGNRKNDEGKKKISCKEKKWDCEDTPLWRIFMKSYVEQEKKLEIADKLDRRKPPVLSKFPNVSSSEEISPLATYPCFSLNTFNLEERARLPDKRNPHDKVRLWRNMKNDPSVDTTSFLPDLLPEVSKTDSGKWPGTWPCVKRDLAGEMRNLEKLKKRRAKGLLPCQEDTDSDSSPDVPHDDFADHKELGHARVPISCPGTKKSLIVDRSSGDKPGLVDGDYVVFLFDKSSNDDEANLSYADVCLRGLKGMHLAELSDKRIREKTWKFCFYQAVVALLAKTQLRYKFAWSINVDYIFDHAWMLFVHMGSLNVKDRIRLDDVVVYNYKYSVELELVHEMKDAPRLGPVDWNYTEKDCTSILKLERPELMKTRAKIGWEKQKIRKIPAVHDFTREIEKWFGKLPEIYHNCVLRTAKFSLAFWKDGNFWYLFNPYRCDVFGLWYDQGYACIMKFCSKISLKRHLMILLLRAYSYESDSPIKLIVKHPRRSAKQSANVSTPEETSDPANNKPEINDDSAANETFTIQIYQMIYHCAQIHNVKLLQRKSPDPRMERTKKREIDDCGMDPSSLFDDPCEQSVQEDDDDSIESETEGEKFWWLKVLRVTWARFATSDMRGKDESEDRVKLRWHQYYVEVPLRVFTLWGEIHPTGDIFAMKNRGKQIWACYVVCAGMTRIQAPEYWSSKILDSIVMCGDRYYTMSKLESPSNDDETILDDDVPHEPRYLGKTFKIGETLLEVDVLGDICGRLYEKNQRNLWGIVEQTFLRYNFAILTCENSCIGIYKFCGSYYMMDAKSVGPPIFQYGDGVAYLVRATSYKEFIKILVLTIGTSECSLFTINPIVIGNMIDLGTTDNRDRIDKIEFRKFDCPYENDLKKTKKLKSKNREAKKRTIDKVSCKKPGCEN